MITQRHFRGPHGEDLRVTVAAWNGMSNVRLHIIGPPDGTGARDAIPLPSTDRRFTNVFERPSSFRELERLAALCPLAQQSFEAPPLEEIWNELGKARNSLKPILHRPENTPPDPAAAREALAALHTLITAYLAKLR